MLGSNFTSGIGLDKSLCLQIFYSDWIPAAVGLGGTQPESPDAAVLRA
jgi:hypothetical protein